VREGEAVGILVGFECGFVHEATNGEMSHQEPIELLPNQIGRLAAQDDVAPRRWVFNSSSADSISQRP
jgi:hypothetical protein